MDSVCSLKEFSPEEPSKANIGARFSGRGPWEVLAVTMLAVGKEDGAIKRGLVVLRSDAQVADSKDREGIKGLAMESTSGEDYDTVRD